MTTWVALLRGINLGRARRVAMADLRALLEGLGYGEVRTLLQSGNAVFTGTGPAGKLETSIEREIEKELGLRVTVMVRSAAQLRKIVAANPFAGQTTDPKQLHVVFLSAPPSAASLDALDPDEYAPDEYAVGDRVIYLRLPNGVAGSRFPWDRSLNVDTTMRNWNTTTKLAELAAAT
ncbi:MAG: DUF1697 domain-containing protein [Acidimicrobiales bacterium]